MYIRSLRETLRAYEAARIMEMQKGTLRVRPETFLCDAYRFCSGDSEAIGACRGWESMSAYSGASLTESLLFWRSVARDGSARRRKQQKKPPSRGLSHLVAYYCTGLNITSVKN